MKARPIPFNSAMVRAVLSGCKTQTRRVMKLQPPTTYHQLATCVDTTGKKSQVGKHHWIEVDGANVKHSDDVYFSCPYGYKGDQLWVRETWAAYRRTSYEYDECELVEDKAQLKLYGKELSAVYKADNKNFPDRWKPSIFMPRWASRIQLEITNIRVERLNDCSEDDAKAEGVIVRDIIYADEPKTDYSCIAQYKVLWESINGEGSWEVNPWVWVIEFKVIKP